MYLCGDEINIFEDSKCKFCIRSEYEVEELIKDNKFVNRFKDDINKALKSNGEKINFDSYYFRIDVGYVITHGLDEGGKAVIDKYNEVN